MLKMKWTDRAVTIATYALCGYANPGSIGVTLASLGAICPQRREDFARLVVRAFVAGTCTDFSIIETGVYT
jgi:nucleoside permease NupC